jgi:hypothetical protein
MMPTIRDYGRGAMNKCEMLLRLALIAIGTLKRAILILMLLLLLLLLLFRNVRRYLVGRLSLCLGKAFVMLFIGRIVARGCSLRARYTRVRSVALQLFLDAAETRLLGRSFPRYSRLMGGAKMAQQDIVPRELPPALVARIVLTL